MGPRTRQVFSSRSRPREGKRRREGFVRDETRVRDVLSREEGHIKSVPD